MGNGTNNAVVVGTIPKVAKAGHREDYIVRVLQPTKRSPDPSVELRVYVDNQNTSPPYQGLTSKGGYFRMDITTFRSLVALSPKVEEAYAAIAPQEGQEVHDLAVPTAPNLELLGGVTVQGQ